jgi:hypothetical protein
MMGEEPLSAVEAVESAGDAEPSRVMACAIVGGKVGENKLTAGFISTARKRSGRITLGEERKRRLRFPLVRKIYAVGRY